MEPVETHSPGYHAARESAAYIEQTAAGYLHISGSDQQAFIQRQTTNDIRLLEAGQTQLTVLTNPAARILDVLTLFLDPGGEKEEIIAALTLPGRGLETASYLKSRIFFMDKVTVSDLSDQFVQFDLLGPRSAETLMRLGLEVPIPGHHVSGVVNGQRVQLLAHHPAIRRGYRLIAAGPELADALRQAGAENLTPESYLVLRVEAGLPEADYELREDFTPLETGLQPAISDNKGCYTGQEVIARQITYDKVTQSLCGLNFESAPLGGDRVWSGGRSIGRLTSAVNSPRFGDIGLAILRRPYHEPGTQVLVGITEEESCPATVTDLPFGTRE